MTGQPNEIAVREKKLLLWGYVLQWGSLVIPLAIIASPIYLLVVRNQVSQLWLRTHIKWQLATCGIIVAAATGGAR